MKKDLMKGLVLGSILSGVMLVTKVMATPMDVNYSANSKTAAQVRQEIEEKRQMLQQRGDNLERREMRKMSGDWMKTPHFKVIGETPMWLSLPDVPQVAKDRWNAKYGTVEYSRQQIIKIWTPQIPMAVTNVQQDGSTLNITLGPGTGNKIVLIVDVPASAITTYNVYGSEGTPFKRWDIKEHIQNRVERVRERMTRPGKEVTTTTETTTTSTRAY